MVNSALEDQTGRRAVGEQPSLMISDLSFGSSDATAGAQDDAFCLDQTCLRRDRPQERNLERQRRLSGALPHRRLDGKAHTAVEQRGRETTVHRAGRIEVSATRLRGDDDSPAHRFGHVVAQGLGYCIKRQRAFDKPWTNSKPLISFCLSALTVP